jgi:bleomycin hydrolase
MVYKFKNKINCMKIKIIALAFFLLFPFYPYCQNLQILKGSWMGNVSTSDFSMQIIFRFEVRNDLVKGFLDSPDEGFTDIPIDKIRYNQDSIFTDLGSATVFKGLMLPGDTVIEGFWGGNIPLRLSRTKYEYIPGSNLNPLLEGYNIIKLIQSTPIKDQQATGTCWSHATTSFIETEAMRLGKDPIVLSPMFYVVPTYVDKAEKYIRMNGKSYFDQGDLTFSVMKAYKQYGAIPEKIYSGKIDSTLRHFHGDMARDLTEKANYYVKKGRGTMTTIGYRNEIEDICCKEMGKVPANFIYEGKNYTPKSFASERIGINPDDYVEITSFSHHPFYSRYILEIESNWNNNFYLNLPLADFTELIDNALMNNYSVCWDGDIHEGYNNGFAILKDPVKNITEQIRQNAFDNFTTQDVHNMHIIGIAENDKGNKFYIIKNSSALKNCGGYLYMSKEFLLLKTISVMVHKDALAKDVMTKTGYQF